MEKANNKKKTMNLSVRTESGNIECKQAKFGTSWKMKQNRTEFCVYNNHK